MAHWPARGSPRRNRDSSGPTSSILFADDMGYSDLGRFGGEIRTPNLDSLAKGGVRFTQFYNTARCCPTRATLLTGLYPHQTGVGHMVNPRPLPGYAGDLNREAPTIAEVLKPAGYQTFMSGKWHVTPVNDTKHNWPLQRGFDHYYGIIHGAANYFDPVTPDARQRAASKRDKPDLLLHRRHRRQRGAVHREHAPSRTRSSSTPPSPRRTGRCTRLEPDIARYKGRYKDGWDALRAGAPRAHDRDGRSSTSSWPLTPRDTDVRHGRMRPTRNGSSAGWRSTRRRSTAWIRRSAGFSTRCGRTGQHENTLVLFFADNGGCAEELGPNAASRRSMSRDARSATVNRWTRGNRPELMPGGENTYPVTACRGRTRRTRRSACTNIGCTRAGSRRRSSRTGRSRFEPRGS